ncbi:cystinosin-like [Uloborus diversus]|uniref:cystinosin-like n=1 Tax=Uloborus diversus TaxID=327109 RepID=UPI002409DEEE|nr:cystinosin-like [Uloborus diversus]XP_054714297.1 cystinosin-like [Uloborus diversus]
MNFQSLVVHILFILGFSVISSLAVKPVLTVLPKDLTFGVHENGSFTVNLHVPAPENITIYFNYSDGNNLFPLPNDKVIEENSTANFTYNVQPKDAGHTTVLVKASPPVVGTKDAFVRVGVYKKHGWVIVSDIIGWLYFICWSISFYPQIIDNYRRKSVVGLNFDFLGLNLTGFIAYSVFNIGLKFVREVQLEYHSINPTGVIPVEINDVVFAVHATFATAVCIGQCFIYERGDQLISKTTVAALALVWSTAAVFLLLTALDVNKYTPWLTFLYFFSYVKLGVTLTKYIPQAVFNYKRKSTAGWSIGTVLFDVVGGLFSIGQMFIIAYNFNDWYSIVGNFTKFGLGLASITFDVIFMVQHFILYRKHPGTDSMENSLMA